MNLVFDGSAVSFITAYIAGFLTFFASCLLPIVPTYLGYLSGISFRSLGKKENTATIVKTATIFVSGFVSVFILLGLALHRVSWTLLSYRPFIEKISGIFFLILGLYLLGIFQSPFIAKERRLPLHTFFEKNLLLHAFLTGVGFGFGWTPCIGPVLAVILYWSSQAGTALLGSTLLISFGLGLGTPFILISFAFEKLVPLLKKYTKISFFMNILSGIVILIFGLLLLFGKLNDFSIGVMKLFSLSTHSL